MYPLLKRFFDFLFSLIGILLAAPIMAVAIVVLRFTGEGSVFFVQERVGHKNKRFKILKFTTMLSAAPAQKNKTNIGKRDPRITPIGAFFRNSKIDELPQMINVLKGDMSFVGPRPLMEVPDFISYPPEVQETIYNVRPGITAIGSVVFRDEAQIISQVKEEGQDPAEFKSKVIFPYKGKVEMWYNENQSFWVDFKILLLTAWTLIFPTSQLAYTLFPDLPERTDALKVEFDRMQQLKESITLLAIVVAALIPIIQPKFWFLNNWQFILMAIIPVVYFAYLLLRKNKIPVRIEKADLGWLIFISLGFLSFFWATNGGLVWYLAFGWLCLIMWMLLFRSLTPRDTSSSFMPMLFSIFFLIIMVYHIAAIGSNIELMDGSWNHFFGKNANYTSAFLVSFYPFLLFYEGRFRMVHIVKTVFSFAMVFVLYLTDAQWATLAFLLVLIYYSWTNLPRGQFWNSFIGVMITLFFVGLMGFFNPIFLQKIPIIKQVATVSTHFKYYLIQASLWTAIENPILGVGLGNWPLHIYHQLDFSHLNEFNYPTTFRRIRSHNLYTQHLVELGMIGLLAFLYSIGSIIRRSLSFKKQLDGYEQAAFASVLVYLFTAFFYADISFYEHHFSGIHILAFCSLGILSSKNSETFYILPNRMNAVFLGLSIACLVWFGYSKYSYNLFFHTQQKLSTQNPQKSIQDLESLYQPVFKTNLDYENVIPFEIAKLYQQIGENDKAEHWFQTAISQNPNNETILLGYAQFLWQVRKDSIKAEALAQQIYQQQNNHYELNLLLAEIALSKHRFNLVRNYLSVFERGKEDILYKRVNELKIQLEELEK